MAALGGGTCPRFPGPGIVLEGLRGQFDLIYLAAHPRSRPNPGEQNEGGYRRIRHSRIDRISLLDIGPRHRSSAAYPTKISAVLLAPPGVRVHVSSKCQCGARERHQPRRCRQRQVLRTPGRACPRGTLSRADRRHASLSPASLHTRAGHWRHGLPGLASMAASCRQVQSDSSSSAALWPLSLVFRSHPCKCRLQKSERNFAEREARSPTQNGVCCGGSAPAGRAARTFGTYRLGAAGYALGQASEHRAY